MRSSVNIFFCFVLSLISTSIVDGQNTFHKYFPFGSGSLPSDVIVNKDSTFTMIAQFTSTSSSSPGLVLSKFDKQGALLLQKDYLSSSIQGYYCYFKNKLFIPVNENSFLVIGGFFNSNNKTGILVAKINGLTLDTAWVKYYSDQIFDLPTSHIIKLNHNSYWLIGNKFDNNTPSYSARPVIFHLDTLGNISFRKEVSNLLNFNPDALLYDSIVKHIYIAGTNFTIPSVPQSYVACIDTNASVLWNKEIGVNPYRSNFFAIEKKNDYLILSGSRCTYHSGNTDRYKPSLLKIGASNGNLIWQKLYGNEGLNTLSGFSINADESIVSSGSIAFSSPSLGINWDGIIMKTNAAGEGLWMKSFSTYTGSYQEMLTDCHSTLDGGYILCGSPSAQNTQSWAIKTDSLGDCQGAVTRTLSTEDITNYTSLKEFAFSGEGFVFYPNPVKDILHIKFSTIPLDILSLSIQDLSGRVLINQEVGSDISTYDVGISSLENGVYIFSLNKSGIMSQRCKIVISK